MRTNLFWIKLLIFSLALTLPFTPTKAALLSPGTSIGMSLEVGPVGASLLATTNVSFNGLDFGNNILFSGSLVSSVWANDSSNPFAGGLTFTYQLTSASTSINNIDRLTLNRFTGFSTDVGFNGPGTVPSRVSRTLSGDLIAFVFENASFLPNLAPGESSPILVIQTDSTVWSIGNASIIDGATANVPVIVPLAVPEPVVSSLIIFGLAAFAVRKKF